ncbi:MAG: ATP-binding protein [Spirochaetia bacterium]|nr:ATP-binding protein [Spirochaetia bacterium]
MKSLSIDALPFPAAVIDASHTILSLNRRCIELIGGENESNFYGRPLQDLLYAHPQGDIQQILKTCLDGRLFKAAVMHSEGHTLIVNGRVQPEPESQGFLILFEPEPESIECILARVLIDAPHYTQAYKELLNRVSSYFGFDGGALYLKSTNENQLDFKYSHGLSEAFRHFLSNQSSREWSGIHSPLLFERRSRKNPISPLLQEQGVQAMLLLPITGENSLYAMVVLFALSPENSYSTHLLEAETVANYLGMLFSRLSYEEKQDSGEKLFKSLVRSMPSGLLVRDKTERVILYNLAAARLLGLRNDTSLDPKILMKGLQIFSKKGELLEKEKLPSIVSLKEGRKIRNYELKIIRVDGTYRWVSINSEPLFRTGEISPYASVATFKDITENRRILREFENAKQAAESANQSKSRFLANVSHEIRTPLSGIMGMTDILLSEDLTQEQREQLLLMKDAEESLQDIINKVLELSKIEAGSIIVENNTFQLRSTVKKSVIPLFIGKQDSELTLDISVADDVPNILIGDAQRLQQVLANLVGNAVKFTHRGTITVSVNLEQTAGESATLRFAVKDSGIGISEEEIERIFDSFQQVDSGFSKKQQGFGLGLAITKQLIEIMGGKIWVESTPGRGSSFFFTVSFMLGSGTDQHSSSQKHTIPSPSDL